MKTFTFVIVGLLGIGTTIIPATAKAEDDHDLARISDETGVPIRRLEAQRAFTGFGNGELEKANLLANASGRSFRQIATRRRSGEGWGQIAHDLDLNLGRVVSDAHRSDRAAFHANNGRGKKGDKNRGRPEKDFKKAGPRGMHGHGH